MPQLLDLTRPMMRGRAGFDPDQTGRLLPEEGKNLAAPQLSLNNDLALGIDDLDLNLVGQVADGARIPF